MRTQNRERRIVYAYIAKWRGNSLDIRLIEQHLIQNYVSAINGILNRMVRQSIPEKVLFTYRSDSWPADSHVLGVTRGDVVDSFFQGQFVIRTPRRAYMLTIFATDEAIPESEMREFFGNVTLAEEWLVTPFD